jgi:hypothetical protein
MAEHEEHLSELKQQIEAVGAEPLTEVEATHLSDQICDTVGEQFEHNPWVDYQQTGDDESQTIVLNSDLDPQAFIGSRQGLKEIKAAYSYSLDGPLDMQIPQVLVSWTTQKGETTQVRLKPNQPARVQTLSEVLGGESTVSDEGILSGTQALALQDACCGI